MQSDLFDAFCSSFVLFELSPVGASVLACTCSDARKVVDCLRQFHIDVSVKIPRFGGEFEDTEFQGLTFSVPITSDFDYLIGLIRDNPDFERISAFDFYRCDESVFERCYPEDLLLSERDCEWYELRYELPATQLPWPITEGTELPLKANVFMTLGKVLQSSCYGRFFPIL